MFLFQDGHQDKKTGSFFQLLKIPGVVVTGFVIVNTSIIWSFLDPTLEPHLRQVCVLSQQLMFKNTIVLFYIL